MPPFQPATKPTLTNTVQSLMTGRVGKSRQRGIITLAKRTNDTLNGARFHQAIRIAQSQARKGK